MILIRKILFFLALVLSISCSKSANGMQTIPENYVISFEDSSSYKTAKKCFDLFKTKINPKLISLKNSQEAQINNKSQMVNIEVDANLETDTKVIFDENTVFLIAKNSNTATWLFVNYIKKMSETDARIDTKDIPPSFVPFDELKNFKFAFEYREPFFAPNLDTSNNNYLATNNLEVDWGIWGHNFGKLLSKEPKNTCFSKVDGELNKEQICFSSDETYSFLENYILENFGSGKKEFPINFSIVPNDNTLVCQCEKCVDLGNTSKNATPSMLYFLNKIAYKFPNHNFFTVDYLTIKSTNLEKLANNIGVFISTIDNPNDFKFDHENQNLKDFVKTVTNWKSVTNKVYVWDYASNFDDYLTPFPNLFLKQEQLKFYKKLGITGVFLNASGYEYTTFQDIKTYVFAGLLANPNLNCKILIEKYCQQFYPKTGQKITDYLLKIENNFKASNKKLNLYGGIKEATKLYLNQDDFFEFYNYLLAISTSLQGQEKIKVDKLITALSFSKTQIHLANGSELNGYLQFDASQKTSLNPEFLKSYTFLKNNFEKNKILNFKETSTTTKTYCEEIEKIIMPVSNIKNKLLFKNLEILSRLDEDYQNANVLTDGLKGIPSDYHTNWFFITTQDLVFNLPEVLPKSNYILDINFLFDKKLKTYPPSKIEIYENDKLIKTNLVENLSLENGRISIKTAFSTLGIEKIKVKIYRNALFKKLVIDEVALY